MQPEDSVTQWLSALADGDADAAQKLWERYFASLMRLAEARLPPQARRASDEEDVALSALNSFFQGIKRRRFPQLHDRHDLWRLLLVITARKAQAHVRHQTRLKRGAGRILGESALAGGPGPPGIEQIIGTEPTPELVSCMMEDYGRLLNQLGDNTLRQVALLKVEGFTVEEIAQRLGCARRSVERRLRLIRKTWSAAGCLTEEAADDS
jgi:DNA-directed RNA polymerase specialized sigma24 family protein